MGRAAKVPVGYCQCGCGQKTNPAPKTSTRNGWIKGEPLRFVDSHNRVGSRAGPDYTETESGCWEWQRLVSPEGYARAWADGAVRLVHRVNYERVNGPVPDGRELDHLCRNRLCVNPAHLEPVVRTTNIRRGSGTKLTQADVDAIRRSSAAHADLARAYDVHPTHILRIRRGDKWRERVDA